MFTSKSKGNPNLNKVYIDYRGDIVNELGECGFAFPHAILDPVFIFSLFWGGGKILKDENHKSPGVREGVG